MEFNKERYESSKEAIKNLCIMRGSKYGLTQFLFTLYDLTKDEDATDAEEKPLHPNWYLEQAEEMEKGFINPFFSSIKSFFVLEDSEISFYVELYQSSKTKAYETYETMLKNEREIKSENSAINYVREECDKAMEVIEKVDFDEMVDKIYHPEKF